MSALKVAIGVVLLLLGQQLCSTEAANIKSCGEVCQSDKFPCSGGLCLVRLPGYSSGSVPKGLPNAPKMILKDEKKQECCTATDDAHKLLKELCIHYENFTKTISGRPLQVMMGTKLKKVWRVDEADDNFLAHVGLTMRWIDPQLRLCKCRGKGVQKEILRLDALDGVKVWLPDLHIFELREDEELLKGGESGLVRGHKESDVNLSPAGGDDQVAVTQNIEIVTEMACHINLTYFPFEMNKCRVRFGSYSHNYKKVVFTQTSLSPPSHPNTMLSLEVYPLPAKDRWVKRAVASGPAHHVYDGFFILIDQSKYAVLRHFVPYAGVPFILVVASALGYCMSDSAAVDRGPFLSVLLLGGVILYTEAINNLPHGSERVPPPLIDAVKSNIGAIFFSFLCFFVMMKMIGMVEKANLPKGERLTLVFLILGFGGVIIFFWYNTYTEATITYPCHNMIH